MNLLSGISSILAIGVLTPVQSIFWLIVLFTSTAISLYNNNYVLMGILYILIYVGAIAILFLFILSLLKIEYNWTNKPNKYIIYALLICLIPLDLVNEPVEIIMELENITNELEIIGNIIYSEYSILLILIGIVLILSIVGAISIIR